MGAYPITNPNINNIIYLFLRGYTIPVVSGDSKVPWLPASPRQVGTGRSGTDGTDGIWLWTHLDIWPMDAKYAG